MGNNEGTGQNNDLLRGWQAIANHFGRNQSTVRRWAESRALPVHRAAGEKGVSVYAYANELDTWLTQSRAGKPAGSEKPEPAEAPQRFFRIMQATPDLLRWAIPLALVLAMAGVGSAIWLQQGGSAPAERRASAVPDEAHDLYLRGTYLWNRRTPEGISGAIEALTQALEIHPDYAEAHAGLAMTYNLARQYSDMSGWDAYAKAEEHARRAVDLDPDYAFGQAVLAFVEFHWLWQVEDGLARFEQAMRLDPDDANTLMWYGSSLIHDARPAEALVALERAQEFDPDNTTILNMKAQALFYDGREQEGLALIQELIDRDPAHPWNYAALSLMRLGQANYAGYLENYARLGDRIGVSRYRVVAEAGLAALAEGGEEAMAAAMVEADTVYYDRGEALAWDIAGHYAMVGNWHEAVPWLRVSLDRHEERLIGLKLNPAFRPIRYRPEVRQLLVEIGYPSEG